MWMLDPVLQICRLVEKLARDIIPARDAFQAGAHFAVSANNAGNSVATTAAKLVKMLSTGSRISARGSRGGTKAARCEHKRKEENPKPHTRPFW